MLGEDCLSEWRNVLAGLPQGTKLGPWLFILMIDDINTSNTELWKYMDDTTIAECVDKKEDSHIQSDLEELIANSNQNKFQLNESKCKDIRILFAKSAADFAPIVINGKADRVRTGPGKPGKSWNFILAFSRTGKSWKKATGPGKFWKSV